jgi:4-amino-4-deoxy-L-arabinose transferase-like glycosyltransferase
MVWLLYIALQTGGIIELAQRYGMLAQLLEPGFIPSFNPIACGIALVFTAGWIAIIILSQRSPYRGVTRWAAGVTLAWALVVTLWMPSIDYGKSYRAMAESLKAQLAQDPARDESACVASFRLGEPQRASLHYFAGLLTQREEVAASDCGLLLVQGSASDDNGNPGEGWKQVWQGNRPGDRSERYRLYRRLAQ